MGERVATVSAVLTVGSSQAQIRSSKLHDRQAGD
jgi:hypothetical protein